MNNITVVINASNAKDHIKSCVQNAALLNGEVLVYVTNTTDQTAAIAAAAGARVIVSELNVNYVEPARKAAILEAKNDWVFILDVDEELTDSLVQEVLLAINNKDYTHYKIPRKNIFGGIWHLKNGGWWPDAQMRLLNKKFLQDWPAQIHSTPKIDGNMGQLKEAMLHFFHGNLEQMVAKTTVYEAIEADLLYKAGRSANTKVFFRKFFGELYRRLIKNKGYLDGYSGILESFYQAYSKTITYLYVYEKGLDL